MQSTAETRNVGGSWQGLFAPRPHRRASSRPAPRVRPVFQLLAAWIAAHDGDCVFGAIGRHGNHDCSVERGFAVLVA